MLNYTPLNGNIVIQKIETSKFVVAGEEQDINAVLTGKVIAIPEHSFGVSSVVEHIALENTANKLLKKEVQFIRGQSRKIKLDGEEYFLVQEDKLLLVRNK